jgi:hypothetical protein
MSMNGTPYRVRETVTPDGDRRWAIQRRSLATGEWISTGPASWETPEQAQAVLDRIAAENGWQAEPKEEE